MTNQNTIQKILEKHKLDKIEIVIGKDKPFVYDVSPINAEMEALAREISEAIIKQFEDWGYANMDELESIKKDFTLTKAEEKDGR